MRVILVPLVGDDDDGAGLTGGYTIAGPFRAHIDAMFMRPDPIEAIMSLEGEATPELIDNIAQASTAIWNARAKLAKQAFELLDRVLEPRVVYRTYSFGRQQLELDNCSTLVVQSNSAGAGHGCLNQFPDRSVCANQYDFHVSSILLLRACCVIRSRRHSERMSVD